MKEPNLNFELSVRIILRNEEHKILLLERTDANNGGFSLPGGTIEKKESPIQTIKRETAEEIGLQLKKKHLNLVHVLQRRRSGPVYDIIYFFEATKWEGTPVILEPEKFSKVQWFADGQMPQNFSPVFSLALKSIKEGKTITYLAKKRLAKK